MVVAPGVGRSERVALRIVRLRPHHVLESRVEQRMHGPMETEFCERLGFARARPETGAPEQPLGLLHAKSSPVHGNPHGRIVAALPDSASP